MGEIAHQRRGRPRRSRHPALLDPQVRQAIAHAIDRETIVDRVLDGPRQAGRDAERLPRPEVDARARARGGLDFDLDKANADPRRGRLQGHRRRRRPRDAGRRRSRSTSRTWCAPTARPARPMAEFFTGWLKRDRHRDHAARSTTTASSRRSSARATTTCSSWGWTPFVDPDPMLSYFTCDQVASDPEDPTDYYNDANWCDPEYDKLYQQQKVELDRAKRVRDRPRDAASACTSRASTTSLYDEPDSQAYVRTASRVGCSSPRRPGRCSSRTRRRPTRG